MLTLNPETLVNQLIASNQLEHWPEWRFLPEKRTWSFDFDNVELRIRLSDDSLHSKVLDSRLALSRKVIDSLRFSVREILEKSSDQLKPLHEFQVAVVILQIVEHVLDWQSVRATEQFIKRKSCNKWRADEIKNWDLLLNNPFGLDVSSIADTASHILQQSPEQICSQIPPVWRVVHMESIIRSDHTKRFFRYKNVLERNAMNEHTKSLGEKLPPHSTLDGRIRSTISRSDILDDLVRPRVTFHGTPLRNVGSIVQHGFKLPGNVVDGKVVASPRTNIVYDRGIYSSQSPAYALSFASGQRQPTPLGNIPSMRLFVCATLMGRTSNDAGAHTEIEGFDAYFDRGFEYVVHDERAMLPCYVVHLDLGSEAAKQAILQAQNEPEAFQAYVQDRIAKRKFGHGYVAPGDRKREQERKKAAAMKWFPYGFGTSRGTSFKIEEIGEISDDEEEYGEWQVERHSYTRPAEGAYEGLDSNTLEYDGDDFVGDEETTQKQKGCFLDQYQQARRSTARLRS